MTPRRRFAPVSGESEFGGVAGVIVPAAKGHVPDASETMRGAYSSDPADALDDGDPFRLGEVRAATVPVLREPETVFEAKTWPAPPEELVDGQAMRLAETLEAIELHKEGENL